MEENFGLISAKGKIILLSSALPAKLKPAMLNYLILESMTELAAHSGEIWPVNQTIIGGGGGNYVLGPHSTLPENLLKIDLALFGNKYPKRRQKIFWAPYSKFLRFLTVFSISSTKKKPKKKKKKKKKFGRYPKIFPCTFSFSFSF